MFHKSWIGGVLMVLVPASVSVGDVVMLQPVDDATIGTAFPDNPGNGAQLVLEGWVSGYIARPLLKFDLGPIPDDATVLSAELTLLHNLWSGNSAASFPTEVWRMPSDDWSEGSVTWNSCDQTGSVAVAIRQPQPQNWDVLEPWVWNIRVADWNYAADLLHDAVTFEARWSDENNQWWKFTGFSSKEGTVVPTLRIEFGGLRGDANCDGNVDFFDIDPFLLALFDLPQYTATYCGGAIVAADCDCSSAVNFFDIDPFLACLFGGCPACP